MTIKIDQNKFYHYYNPLTEMTAVKRGNSNYVGHEKYT